MHQLFVNWVNSCPNRSVMPQLKEPRLDTMRLLQLSFYRKNKWGVRNKLNIDKMRHIMKLWFFRSLNLRTHVVISKYRFFTNNFLLSHLECCSGK